MSPRLENQLRFETLLTNLSARFVRLAYDEIDREIEYALAQVLRFFQADRCGLLQVSDKEELAFLSHAFYEEGIEQLRGDVNLAQLFPWAYEQLILKGRSIKTTSLDSLPPEAHQDKACWAAMGVYSSLDIPLFIGQEVRYIIAIQSLTAERNWPEKYVPRLRLLGEIFINALERKKADEALHQSETRLRLATDSAKVGLWIMNTETKQVWVTPRTRLLFHFGADEALSYQDVLNAIYPEDRSRVHAAVEESIALKNGLCIEYRIAHPQGELRWISSQGRYEAPASGNPARLMGASIDITQRKVAEQALQHLSGQLLTTAEKERRRIARDLHDNYSQQLALLALELDLLVRKAPQSEEDLQEKLAVIASSVHTLSSDMQQLSHQLHPAKLEHLGLLTALSNLAKEISDASGIEITFTADPIPESLPKPITLTLYRIAQETLQNILKHSEAKEASMTLSTQASCLHLVVRDAGKGFVVPTAFSGESLGLISIQERTRLVDGVIQIDAAPGKGSCVEVRIPFEPLP